MSVSTHLTNTASRAVLSTDEGNSIETSLSTLAKRIKAYFGGEVTEHFAFGSYTRETILPRKIDEHSDVDYMVVFKDGQAKTQTYLDRLKRFVEHYYTSSEIHQSHPTIMLELSHIKFELVPALSNFGGYHIPGPQTGWQNWIATYPNAFNATLTSANTAHGYHIKPMIRLLKYWNARNDYVYESSFLLEQNLVNSVFFRNNLKEYVFAAFDGLSLAWDDAKWRKDAVSRAKMIVNNTRYYEQLNLGDLAEAEIKKLIPAI